VTIDGLETHGPPVVGVTSLWDQRRRRRKRSAGTEEAALRGSGQTARTSSFFIAVARPGGALSSIRAISSTSTAVAVLIKPHLSVAVISATSLG
jgi:hypothetical protein